MGYNYYVDYRWLTTEVGSNFAYSPLKYIFIVH